MQIEFQNTNQDYYDFYKIHFKNAFRKRIAAIILISLFIGFRSGGQPFNWLWFLAGFIITFLILTAAWSLIPYLISVSRIKKLISNEGSYIDKNELKTTEEGLNIESKSGTIIWKWESIFSVDTNQKFITIILADKSNLLIPKRNFSSDVEVINFLGIIETGIVKVKGTANRTSLKIIKSKPPYLLGLLCLIPLLGAIAGLIFVVLGISHYKDKWFTLIGVFGILFTICIYSFLFYYMKNGKLSKDGFAEISQMQLNSLVKNIEFYKLEKGHYPDSLKQLLKDDQFANINDAIQLNQQRQDTYFNYQKIGDKYLLYSSGPDGIPNTKDDLYAQISVDDSSKIGLIKSR